MIVQSGTVRILILRRADITEVHARSALNKWSTEVTEVYQNKRLTTEARRNETASKIKSIWPRMNANDANGGQDRFSITHLPNYPVTKSTSASIPLYH